MKKWWKMKWEDGGNAWQIHYVKKHQIPPDKPCYKIFEEKESG